MKTSTLDSPTPPTDSAPVSRSPIDLTELVTGCMTTAVVIHLLLASAGGNLLLPWLGRLFAEAPKPKVEKKEVAEVELVEAVVAEPPPPPPTPPTDQPPPPPDALPAPTEPQLQAPVLSTPVEIPDRAPLPVLRQVAPVPTASVATRTDLAPYVPGPATTGPVTTAAPRTVQARFYQRSEPVYPYEARKRRLQGTVVLEAVFGADGRLVGLEIKQSSGQPMLDKAAVAHGTQSFYSTTGQAERVLIPVEYRLITL